MNLYEAIVDRREKIAVVGLGYVGLPAAVAIAEKTKVIGFDVNRQKVQDYRNGICSDGSIGPARLRAAAIDFTDDVTRLKEARFFIITVPTPVKSGNVPDLRYVQEASRMVARQMPKGSVVVFESTVYPGVTEEVCIPILESESRNATSILPS